LELASIEDAAELVSARIVGHILFDSSTGRETFALELGLGRTIDVFSHFS